MQYRYTDQAVEINVVMQCVFWVLRSDLSDDSDKREFIGDACVQYANEFLIGGQK